MSRFNNDFLVRSMPLESHRGWTLIREYLYREERMRYVAKRGEDRILSYDEDHLLMAIDYLTSIGILK